MSNVGLFDSAGADYHRSFSLFLKSTDQKTRAREWLLAFAAGLTRHSVFVDAGAGAGDLTIALQPLFAHTVAIEPNPQLRGELERKVPGITVHAKGIEEMELSERADLVLCSHVLYLVDKKIWLNLIQRMANWLAPGGKLVLIAQSPDTDCKRLLKEFGYQQSNLRDLREQLPAHRVRLETIASCVKVGDLEQAVSIAEFILSNPDLKRVPTRAEVEAFLQAHFRQADGSFLLSCDQDLLIISG